MPWQQLVADVSKEIDPKTGRLAYDEVVVLVTRQSGKTTLELADTAHRCSATDFYGRRQRCVYTAQDRGRARKKFEEEFVPVLQESPTFGPRTKPHWGNGNEHIKFLRSGATWAIEANTESAGHGGTLDKATLDEAFSRVDNRQEVAFGPAMITRANKQLWVVSTAGWLDQSPYLEPKVRLGRERCEEGRQARVAYFEWSAPEGTDPADEAAWWLYMPALGHTIDPAAIRAELEKALEDTDGDGLAGFQRSYMNLWVPKHVVAKSAIDPEVWAALADREQERPAPIALSVVVSDDRKWSQVGLAGRRSDGRRHVQVVKAGRGTRWVADEVQRLVGEWKPASVALRSGSAPEASLIGALEAVKVPVLKVSGPEAAQACGLFEDGIEDAQLAHGGQPQVAVAVGAADKKFSAGGSFTWVARKGADISPLWALTLADYALGKAKMRRNPEGSRRAVIL